MVEDRPFGFPDQSPAKAKTVEETGFFPPGRGRRPREIGKRRRDAGAPIRGQVDRNQDGARDPEARTSALTEKRW